MGTLNYLHKGYINLPSDFRTSLRCLGPDIDLSYLNTIQLQKLKNERLNDEELLHTHLPKLYIKKKLLRLLRILSLRPVEI